mmetsp:Transcript_81225/g.218445  ORF Transcript_81225/g.218445 Transcript_81225/m.218445 type:complete len:83 (-) Transcript_81225:846-1094(-)
MKLKGYSLFTLFFQVRISFHNEFQVRNEQVYFRDRELRFRQTTDSTNFRSQWLSILQIAGMLAVTVIQLGYLRNYFVSKKIV